MVEGITKKGLPLLKKTLQLLVTEILQRREKMKAAQGDVITEARLKVLNALQVAL